MLHRDRINLVWLYKLRWAAVVGQLATILFVQRGMGIVLQWRPILIVVAAVAATNAGLGCWLRRRSTTGVVDGANAPPWLIGVIMLVDNLLLTAALYYSGGPFNPFTIFFLVNIALAAVLLPSWWAWLLGATAFASFAILFVDYTSVPALEAGCCPVPAANAPAEGAASLHLHLRGMLIAFGIASAFIVYFVTRVTRELAQREFELSEARRRESQLEKLDALATMAAGAAHELATPLATVAVAARDLESALERGERSADSLDDARAIRLEVDRCRRILNDLALTGGETAGESFVLASPAGLVAEALEGLADADVVHVAVDPAAKAAECQIPRAAVVQSVRALIKNALDASTSGAEVTVSCAAVDNCLQVVVQDEGRGMSPAELNRAGEPFFTTKEPGRGMGLGLFVARRVIERLGGKLTIESALGAGTRAKILLPLRRSAATVS